MKTSFYFTLWGIAFFVLDVINISALENFNLLIACAFVFITDWIVRKFCADEIIYQVCCKLQAEFELVYLNDVKKFKRQQLQEPLLTFLIFTYILACFICQFVVFTDVPIWDYLIVGFLVALNGYALFDQVKNYYKIRNADKVVYPNYDKELLELCQEYCEERKSYGYDELSPEPTKLTKIMNIANAIFAVLSVSLGLLALFQLIPLIWGINNDMFDLAVCGIYGSLAIYFGVKDILSVTAHGNKYLLLLSSFLLVLLLYSPVANFYNKEILKNINLDGFIYLAETNELQKTVKIEEDELKDFTEKNIQSFKDYLMLYLQLKRSKPFLKLMTRVDAGYRLIYKTKKTGRQIDIYISPNELETCYDTKLSAMEQMLVRLNIDCWDYDYATKTYDDGECLVVEYFCDERFEPIDDMAKYMELLKSLVILNTKIYKSDLISLNRGFKIRFIYQTGQAFEASLSLKEIKQINVDTEAKSSKK